MLFLCDTQLYNRSIYNINGLATNIIARVYEVGPASTKYLCFGEHRTKKHIFDGQPKKSALE